MKIQIKSKKEILEVLNGKEWVKDNKRNSYFNEKSGARWIHQMFRFCNKTVEIIEITFAPGLYKHKEGVKRYKSNGFYFIEDWFYTISDKVKLL